jgi:hypothetical protein
MRKSLRVVSGFVLCALVLGVVVGCAVDTEKVEATDARLKALQEKGAPDSVLFDARMLMAEIRTQLKAPGNLDVSGKLTSLNKMLDNAETWYADALEKMKPELEKVKADLKTEMAKISGANLSVADSIVAKSDSIAGVGYLLQAREVLTRLQERLPDLIADEKKGASLRPKVVGVWREVTNPDGEGSTTVLKTVYTLSKNGDMEFQEEKKGQTSDNLKEDWKFRSWGTWEMKGDTVLLHVTRDKCERQVFETLTKKNDKMVWERREEPTYDSTVTSGAKDRSILYADLQTDYKKVK